MGVELLCVWSVLEVNFVGEGCPYIIADGIVRQILEAGQLLDS